jgi:hypothetical protein
MGSALAFCCPIMHCEVRTGILIDADARRKLACWGWSIYCFACGQEHRVQDAYLKLDPTNSASVVVDLLQRRRAKADN